MNQNAFMKVDKATFYDFVTRHDDQRFEYEGGYIVQQMTGGTWSHGNIARNFLLILHGQLDRSRWTVQQDRGVDTDVTVRYPDIVVEPIGAPPDSLSTTVPALIVEVLSPSSTARDLKRKPPEYMGLPSLVAYIVASQDAPAVVAWVRSADGQFPAEPAEISGLDATLDVPALGLNLPLSEIFAGLTFPTAGEADS